MQLIEDLERQKAGEESYFRQHLISEDLSRLNRLLDIAQASTDEASFLKEGKMIGWTPNDMRTHELTGTLTPLLCAIYTRLKLPAGSPTESEIAHDEKIAELWQTFDNNRMERLVGCLARVPAPSDTDDH